MYLWGANLIVYWRIIWNNLNDFPLFLSYIIVYITWELSVPERLKELIGKAIWLKYCVLSFSFYRMLN